MFYCFAWIPACAGMTILCTSIAFAESFWQPVSWTNADGIVMQGVYHGPAQKGRLTWVLLHGLGSTKGEWEPFAREFAKTGQGIFVYDARGHGESCKTVNGQNVSYQAFHRQDWGKMPEDFSGAIAMLEKRFGPSINGYGVGGASLGANVALVYAASTSEKKVRGVLLLSPGVEYAGLNIDKAYNLYNTRPLCMVASPGDDYAYQSVRFLASRRGDTWLRAMEGPGALHGVKMLDSATTSKIIDWMKKVETTALLS